MKRTSFLAIAMLLLAVFGGGGSISAQTDVTGTYLTNPSFEDNGANVAESGEANTISGWTLGRSKADKVVASVWDNTTNATGYGKTVTPADETYYSQIRIRWEDGINSGTLSQTSKSNLPAGLYQLSVKYKAASSNNTNGTEVSLAVKSGDINIGTASGTVKLSEPRNETSTYFIDTEWSVMTVSFYLQAEASINFSIKFAANQNSDAIFDDCRLMSVPLATGWGSAGLESGTYLLKNVKSGRYLGPGNEWGTQASLLPVTHGEVLTLGNAVYTINSQATGYFTGSYMDGAAKGMGILKNSSNQYAIFHNGSYFGYDGSTSVLKALPELTDDALWEIIPVEDALTGATKANPADATFLINDANFDRNARYFDSWKLTGGTTSYAGKGGDNVNLNWQKWNGVFDFNQTVSNLPNGLYMMKAQGFYRPGKNTDVSEEQSAILYAGDVKKPMSLVSSPKIATRDDAEGFTTENTNEGSTYYVPNSQGDASKAFSAGYYEHVLDEILVENATLKIGAKNDATTGDQWAVIDNFRLYYYGPTVSSGAKELPAEALEAGKWYYFDINIEGVYDLELTSLDDIVYTQDASILLEDANTITSKFAKKDELSLTEGRYYVKSSTAQTFVVKAHAFSYAVGEATPSIADGGYTQSANLVIAFNGASTNDPDAAFKILDATKIQVNGTQASATVNGKEITIALAGSVEVGKDYAVSIAAGAIGYNAENSNAAINLSVKTPYVLDGVYYLYDAANELFLGRGAAYGTEAVADKYGVAFNLKTNAQGVSSIEFVDGKDLYLFCAYGTNPIGSPSGIYTDNSSTGWIFEKTTDGFYLKDANGDTYAKEDKGTYGVYLHTVADKASATIWTLKSVAERDAIVNNYPIDNKEAVIEASGISTTSVDFVTYLGENYKAVDVTNLIGTAKFTDGIAERRAPVVGSWTWQEVRAKDGANSWDKSPAYGADFAEVWCATGKYVQTIDKSKLPAGVYKLTVDGFERRATNDISTTLGAAGHNLVSSYLAANEEQVRLKSWYDIPNRPTIVDKAKEEFKKGNAVNEVYVYLDGNTDLTITLNKPNYLWDCWIIFNNFTLTRYERESVNISISSAGYSTFIAPFEVKIPTGLAAYTVDGVKDNGTTLVMTEVETTIPANTPVVLNGAEGVYEVSGVNVATQDSYTEGLLTGVYTDTNAPVGSYVLQNKSEGVAFYYVEEGAQPKVKANRAYLTVPAAANVRALFFGDDEATAIEGLGALTEGDIEGIYSANGVKVGALQKGVNIIKRVDGSSFKVMVK